MSKTKPLASINSFDEEVSIYKILFQDRTTALLKYVIDKLSTDRYENVNFRLPSILLSGKGEGKKLIAKAFSTSMCSRFEHIQGRHLSIGGHCGSLYKNIDSETVYYISLAEELTPSSISMIFKMLTEGSVEFNEYRGSDYKTVSAANKLFIFAVEEAKELCSEFKKAIEYHCFLREYDITKREIILEQRLKWCAADYQKEIPAIIAHNCKTIAGCIRLLSVSFLVMRGGGRTNMTLGDVEKAIGLNSPQELATPPPVDNIPF